MFCIRGLRQPVRFYNDMEKMKNRLAFFLVAFVTWGLLTWIPELVTTRVLDGQHVVAGLAAALIVALLTGNLAVSRPGILKHPHRYWHFFAEYVPVFVWEVIKANLDVAYRVLHPRLPVNPGIVKIKTSLKSDIALTFLANSITLTPGTMSVDIDADNGVLYVHWIDVRSQDVEENSRRIAKRFEEILSRIFD